MKIQFTVKGCDITVIDTDPMTEEERLLARWNQLLDIPTSDLTDEEVAEFDSITDTLADDGA